MKTAGILGGMSWTSSIEYYRVMNQLVYEKLGDSHSAKLILWSVDFREHLDIHKHEGWDGVAEEAIDIARKLRAAGADFLIMAVNTLHRVADQVEAAVDLPLLHIADATAEAIKALGMDKVGLLGTRYTMTEDFYRVRLKERHGIDVVIPNQEDRIRVDQIIFEELVVDRYEESSQRNCLDVMDRLAGEGVQGIVLGCTELPRLVSGQPTTVPTFDTLRIHAQAATNFALDGH